MEINYPATIIKLRAKLDLSQIALAELLGVSFTSINRWENGHYTLTKIVSVKLLKLFKDSHIEIEE